MKSEVELRVYARMGAQSKRSRRPNRSEGHALGAPCRMCAHLRGMCRRAAGPRAALGVGQHDDSRYRNRNREPAPTLGTHITTSHPHAFTIFS